VTVQLDAPVEQVDRARARRADRNQRERQVCGDAQPRNYQRPRIGSPTPQNSFARTEQLPSPNGGPLFDFAGLRLAVGPVVPGRAPTAHPSAW